MFLRKQRHSFLGIRTLVIVLSTFLKFSFSAIVCRCLAWLQHILITESIKLNLLDKEYDIIGSPHTEGSQMLESSLFEQFPVQGLSACQRFKSGTEGNFEEQTSHLSRERLGYLPIARFRPFDQWLWFHPNLKEARWGSVRFHKCTYLHMRLVRVCMYIFYWRNSNQMQICFTKFNRSRQ